MASTKPKVLLLGEIEMEKARDEYASLSSLADLITSKSSNRDEFLKECRSGAFNGTRAVYRTFPSVSTTGRIEGEVAEALAGAGVRFIAHNGAGYDQINVAHCTTHGIHVANTPIPPIAATADTALFLLLGALRAFSLPLLSLRSHPQDFRGNPPPPLGHDPRGKTLGILGMGGIGKDLAKKAQVLGMTVVYHNRRRLSEDEERRIGGDGGVRYVGWEELLETSDVLSLNLPLNEGTRGCVGKKEFERMKRGAVVVNTARGGVMDEGALVEALDSGQIASCGLDVFEEEPKVHPGLIKNPKVMLLPHMGTWTVETQTEMELWTVANVRSALETGKLKSQVAEQRDMPDE
ncbi:MAG: hypothetical protein Q9219_000476 [cf. Caloplaca sp. 3 TL-2023]